MYKYELRIDSDGNEYLFCDSILNDNQIDEITVGKIREKYSINAEFKMNRLAKTTTEWKEYNQYMEDCREAGKISKVQAKLDTEKWSKHQRKSNEDEKNYTKRLKKAELIKSENNR